MILSTVNLDFAFFSWSIMPSNAWSWKTPDLCYIVACILL